MSLYAPVSAPGQTALNHLAQLDGDADETPAGVAIGTTFDGETSFQIPCHVGAAIKIEGAQNPRQLVRCSLGGVAFVLRDGSGRGCLRPGLENGDAIEDVGQKADPEPVHCLGKSLALRFVFVLGIHRRATSVPAQGPRNLI